MIRVTALMALAAIALIAACGKPNENKGKGEEAAKAGPAAEAGKGKAAGSRERPDEDDQRTARGSGNTAWVYSDAEESGGGRTYFACVKSSDRIHLEPENRDATMRLCLRNSESNGNDAYLEILADKGDFVCASGDGCAPQFRFGNADGRRFAAYRSSGENPAMDVIWFTEEGRELIEEGFDEDLPTRVLAEFEIAGMQDMSFPTQGLRWPSRR